MDKNFAYFNEYAQSLDNDSENFWHDYSKTYLGIKISNPNGDFFIAFSKGEEHMKTTLPKAQDGKNWYILFDTSNKEHKSFEPKAFFGLEYILNPNSLVVFKEK